MIGSQFEDEADIETTALLQGNSRGASAHATPEKHLELDQLHLKLKEKERMVAKPGWDKRLLKAGVGLLLMIGFVMLVTLTISWSAYHRTETVKCRAPPGSSRKGDLVFFVVGDWGRANENQMKTAELMNEVAACFPPSAIISAGDNIYPNGLHARDDPQFMDKFLCPYSTVMCSSSIETKHSNIRGVPWYAVLGNHDYGDTMPEEYFETCKGKMEGKTVDTCDPECCASPHHQMPEHNPRIDSAVWDLRSSAHRVPLSEDVDLILVDTSPFISGYQETSWAGLVGGISSQNTTRMKEQVEAALSGSKASIKFLVGHHPIKSKGEHCMLGSDCTETSAWLSPLIKNYGVKVYFSGHEHDLQHSEEDGVHYVVSGAGSDVREGEFDNLDSRFWGRDDQGFAVVVVREGRGFMLLYTVSAGLSLEVSLYPPRAKAA